MLSHLKTALLVTLVTLLIWIFAEAESLTTRTVRAEVAVDTDSDSDLVVEILDGQQWQKRADVVFEGSTAAVAEAEAALRKPVRLRPGMEGVPTSPGEQTLDLFTALRAWPELRTKGVTIVRVDPPNLRIKVDEIVSREVKVAAEVPGSELDGAPEVKPGTAIVHLPTTEVGLLTPASTVRARVLPELVTKLVPGRRETIPNVVLEPPPELANSRHVRIQPRSAEVSLTLRSRVAIQTLASVPVTVVLAAGEYALWEITVPEEDRFITDVKVSGPVDLIDQVKRGGITVTAQVQLSFEELERGIASKDVIFSSIPPAADLQYKADSTKARLKIKRREPVGEPGNGAKSPKPPAG
jgi:hypothetical protein